jgi:hypothetical protein
LGPKGQTRDGPGVFAVRFVPTFAVFSFVT